MIDLTTKPVSVNIEGMATKKEQPMPNMNGYGKVIGWIIGVLVLIASGGIAQSIAQGIAIANNAGNSKHNSERISTIYIDVKAMVQDINDIKVAVGIIADRIESDRSRK